MCFKGLLLTELSLAKSLSLEPVTSLYKMIAGMNQTVILILRLFNIGVCLINQVKLWPGRPLVNFITVLQSDVICELCDEFIMLEQLHHPLPILGRQCAV